MWYSTTAQALPVTIGRHPARQRAGACVTSLPTSAEPAEGCSTSMRSRWCSPTTPSKPNEDLLASRRAWPTDRVLDEFAHWSKAFVAAPSVAVQPLIGSASLRVGSLGRYAVRILPSMLVFDWH